ncbi:hypothetical protein OUZ56_011573 [Daphnia magna]|uniref:Uncharacterized protein n=1 Tax=Daphnia magna TaxID=35525 RepID=A0ABQ9Z0I6_9CRUS|nr:hypothetical protein OUZ56_011573 [Daphnia magna]
MTSKVYPMGRNRCEYEISGKRTLPLRKRRPRNVNLEICFPQFHKRRTMEHQPINGEPEEPLLPPTSIWQPDDYDHWGLGNAKQQNKRHQLHPHRNNRPQTGNGHRNETTITTPSNNSSSKLCRIGCSQTAGCPFDQPGERRRSKPLDPRKQLRTRTALLANGLQNEILNDEWHSAVDTLKIFLDLDPVNRHPPLYEWSTSSWEIPNYRSRQGGNYQ